VFVPAATPRDIVVKLNAEVRRAIAAPEVRSALVNQGAEPASDTLEDFAALVRSDLAKWAKIVKETGAKAD
jgi:tripartite-type tricarboxylate transporter receptor subunit TctC